MPNMIKAYWTSPNLTQAQHKQLKRAAALIRASAGNEPNPNEVIRIDYED